jgi:integrase
MEARGSLTRRFYIAAVLPTVSCRLRRGNAFCLVPDALRIIVKDVRHFHDCSRARIASLLSNLKQKGHANGTIRGVRATFSTVLQAAVERGYLDKNAAHGIRIPETGVRREHRFYSPVQIRQLLTEMPEPCRTGIQVAVLTGMRIGEILALRWKRVDLLRGMVEVAETFSEGEFGSPKTRSSRRVIPMSSTLRQVLEAHRFTSAARTPNDLVFRTRQGTPLSSKNLYNRVLAPACDQIKQRRVSWHSFRHYSASRTIAE